MLFIEYLITRLFLGAQAPLELAHVKNSNKKLKLSLSVQLELETSCANQILWMIGEVCKLTYQISDH